MRKEIKERTCDTCKKVVQQSEIHIGGSPFNGWLRLERTNGSSYLPELNKERGPWDFCSDKCLIEFLKKEA